MVTLNSNDMSNGWEAIDAVDSETVSMTIQCPMDNYCEVNTQMLPSTFPSFTLLE